ncbi:hypothetical protein HY993_01235, partial [Candidatus Micrarchaeota archaeon]|nr:hypothetical protein [Candidatus Micrarchaeota archaeon]
MSLLPQNTALIAFDKKHSTQVLEKLSKLGQVKELPKISSNSFSQEIQSIQGELNHVNSRISELSKDEDNFKKSYGEKIVFLIGQLEAHALKAELPNKFSQTAYLEVIEGWVQKRFEQELIKMVSKTTENKVYVEKIESKEQPPVQLTNLMVVKPFEYLTRFFSLPNSSEGDPSVFLMVFFPLIFGMILGDIGYGFAGLVLSVFLFKKIKSGALHSLAGAVILASLWTILFGYIFGEIFGAEHFLNFTLHPIIERGGESLNDLIILALVMGILHLATGLLLGVYYNVLHKHYSHAAAKAAWLVVEFSLVVIGLSAVSPSTLGPAFLYAAVGGILLATAVIVKTEGVGGAFELPGMLANVLSYLRIMALGLSGVILSKIINQIPVGGMFESLVKSVSSGSIDPVGVVIALVMFVLVGAFFVFGHTIALVLGLFESSIQSLRLQYVEFFSKYYKGGGRPFSPLRSTIKTT